MAWRPYNETPEDLQRELAAAQRIETAWGVQHTKLSEKLYCVDWVFTREEVPVGWGEYKYRLKRYPTLLLSAAKWIGGRALSQATGLPFFLFVEWPEGLHWYKVGDQQLPIRLGGNARGQNGDREPCVFIDTALFKAIRETRN